MQMIADGGKRLILIGCLLVATHALEPQAASASTPSQATGESCLERTLGPTIPEFKAYTIIPPDTRHEFEPGQDARLLLARLEIETDDCLSPLSGKEAVYIVKWGRTRLRMVHDREASAIAFLSRRHAPFALRYNDLDLVDPRLRIEQLNHELVVHLIDPDNHVDARIIIDLTTLDLKDARVEIYEGGEESDTASWDEWGDEMKEYTVSEPSE